MAKQVKFATTDSVKYSEADDERVNFDAQQLVNGELKLENYQPIRELEKIKFEGDQAIQMTNFSTPQEKKMAESLQRNTNGWIDTAKDVLTAVIDVGGLVQTCGPAINAGILKPDDVTRATHHVISLGETLKRIYNRACDNAVKNSDEFLLAIESNDNISKNSTVQTAVKQHRNDVKEFQQGKVSVDVPYQSHAKLRQTIKQVEPNQQSNVHKKAEESSRAWDLAKALGTIVLAAGIIVSMVLLKR
ncbi:unnamed protein product [Rotaria sp. Silwood1]|nr:unnamed protein product [Rotaria sp. Silwood1]CAF1623279.1 unnamed protein product [Rotaria sp. Silwood1]CAF3720642.1 unnamed protein product [Rotaria sp. Silwood1]CAF4862371.1 unnamed protein product [Rotaria sp. Silwood1]